MTKLGNAIRARLQELSKTQGWLAAELGVSNNAVSKWIKSGKISRENALAAARLLEVSVEVLLGEERDHVTGNGESADDTLIRVTEMLEIYRLAGPADRQRIDLAFREARNNIRAADQVKPGAR